MIEAYGISVCQPSPSVAVKNIAGQIGDRDNGVRNAALNAAVQAYMDVGSENQFYKMTGNVSSAGLVFKIFIWYIVLGTHLFWESV